MGWFKNRTWSIKQRGIGYSIQMPSTQCKISRRAPLGFTLMEVMIALVVIAVLAAVAYPNLTRYVIKSRMKAGQHFLAELSIAQERYLNTKRDYANSIGNLGIISVDDNIQRDFEIVSIVINDVASQKTNSVNKFSGGSVTKNLTASALKPGFVAVLRPRSNAMLSRQYRIAINSEGQKWIETNASCNNTWVDRCCRAGDVDSSGLCPVSVSNPNPSDMTVCGRPDWKTWNRYAEYDQDSVCLAPATP